MIKIFNLNKEINDKKIFSNINLEIPINKLTFIIGPSGVGKSTLLNVLGGIDKEYDGTIEYNFNNISIDPSTLLKNNYVDFIFQDYNLFEDLSVEDNLVFPLNFLGHNLSKEEIIKVINELGIKEIQLNEKVKNLSGGEKQRIAIARAILRKSEFILADEPTGNLDTENSENIFKILSSLSKKRTIIVVSHDLEAAKKYGDYIYDLKNNQLLENKSTCNEYLFNDIKNNLGKNNFWNKYKPLLKFSWVGIKRKIISFILMIFLIASTSALLSNTYSLHNNSQFVSTKYFKETNSDFIELKYQNYPTNLIDIKKNDELNNRIGNLSSTSYYSYYPESRIVALTNSDKILELNFDEIDNSSFWTNKLASMNIIGKASLDVNEVIVWKKDAEKYNLDLYTNNELKIDNGIILKIVGIVDYDYMIDLSNYYSYVNNYEKINIFVSTETTKKISSEINKNSKFSFSILKYINDEIAVQIANSSMIDYDENLNDNEFTFISPVKKQLNIGEKYKIDSDFHIDMDLVLNNFLIDKNSENTKIKFSKKTFENLKKIHSEYISGYPNSLLIYFNSAENLQKSLNLLDDLAKEDSKIVIHTNFASLGKMIVENSKDTTKIIFIFAISIFMISIIAVAIFSHLIVSSKSKEIALLKLLGLNSRQSLIYHLFSFIFVALVSIVFSLLIMYPIYLIFTLLINNLALLKFNWLLNITTLFIFWSAISFVSFLIYFFVSLRKFYAKTNRLLKEK